MAIGSRAIVVAFLMICMSMICVSGDVDGPFEKLNAVRDGLLAAAQMPESSQKALLAVMGAGLVASGQLECNLFGGKSACSSVSEKSHFTKSCPSSNLLVDCAFKGEASQEVSFDPRTAMKGALSSKGFPVCEDCFEALHNFWCGQTVPACGTFEKVLEELLPVISQVVNGKAHPVDALQSAVPKVIQAFSLGLPCREMCETVTSTCSCGRPTTFGNAFSIIEKNREQGHGFPTNMSHSTAKALFAPIWNVPICKLFSPKAQPGFLGVCDLPVVPPGECEWCKSKGGRPEGAEVQIVAQLAESISGMMQSGLEKVLDAAGASSPWAKHRSTWNWNEEEKNKSSQGGWGLALLIVFLVLVAGAIGGGIVWYVQRQKLAPVQYMSLASMGYTPPDL